MKAFENFAAALGTALGYLLIYFVAINSAALAIGAWVHNPVIRQFINDNTVTLLLVANSFALIVFFLLFRFRGQNLFQISGFVKTDRQAVMAVIPAGLALGVSIFAIAHLEYVNIHYPEIIRMTDTVANGGNLLMVVLGSVLMGSLLEEILFRGMLLHTFQKRYSLTAAVWWQAGLFGLILMNLPLGIFAALGAVVYGFVRVWGGSIWASLITHMVSTTTLIVLYQVWGDTLSQMVIGSLFVVGVILLCACLWTLNRHAKRGSYAESQFNGS